MNLVTWVERDGVARAAGCHWFRLGLLPVPAQNVGRLILLEEPTTTRFRGRNAVYARMSWAYQKAAATVTGHCEVA